MNNIGLTKYEKKKVIILDATFKCIYEHGIKNLSLRSIAKEAKVNKSDLLYYFKNKENLLTEFMFFLFKRYISDITRRFKESDPPEKKLQALFKAGINFAAKQKKLFVVFIDCWSLCMRSPHLQQIFWKYHEKQYKNVSDIVEKYVGEEVLNDVQKDTLTVFIISFFAGMGILRYASKKPFDYKRYSEEFRKKIFS
jgi:AcrR family transcriptional regulator